MSYVTTISAPAKILPLIRKYLATIHPAIFLIITHVHLTTRYIHAPQNGHYHPFLGAHTHLPLDYACQEADQHTTAHHSTS
jgi:hypothetical protein